MQVNNKILIVALLTTVAVYFGTSLILTNTMHIREIKVNIPKVEERSIIDSIDIAGKWIRCTGNPSGLYHDDNSTQSKLFYTEMPLSIACFQLLRSPDYWIDVYTTDCLAAKYNSLLCGGGSIVAPNESTLLNLPPFENQTQLNVAPSGIVLNAKFERNIYTYLYISDGQLLVATNYWNSTRVTKNISKLINDVPLLDSRLGPLNFFGGQPRTRKPSPLFGGELVESEILYIPMAILIYNYPRDLLLCIYENRTLSIRLDSSLSNKLRNSQQNIETRQGCVTSDGNSVFIGLINQQNKDIINLVVFHGDDVTPIVDISVLGRIHCTYNHIVSIDAACNILILQEWSNEDAISNPIRFFKIRL